jgi:hypothetical protein
MFDQLRVTATIGSVAKKGLGLLALGLICSLPFPAAASAIASDQNQQPAAAQDSASQQADSSQSSSANTEPAAATSADHYSSATDATPSAGTAATPSPQSAAPTAAYIADPDAGWTPASYINAWFPSWLRLSGELREREEAHTGYGFTPGNDYGYDLSRIRIGFDITPNSWFHAFVQARDSEVIGGDVPPALLSNSKDVFDLNQAYVEFRNGENGWFSLKTGRQELYFGDERLIARSNWSNATRSFDAIRLTLGSDNVGPALNNIGARLDIFAASVVKDYPNSFDEPLPGQNFYGFNLALSKIVPWATIEPYVYLKTLPNVTGVDKKKGNEREYTSGLRLAGTIPGGVDYRGRYSFQSGHSADDPIRAWAYYGILGETIPRVPWQPRFSIEFNYASGNSYIGDKVVGTFDQLYPTTHQWERITDLFGEQNIKDWKPGFDFKPTKKMHVYFIVSDLSLASKDDSLYNNSGSVLIKVPKGGALSTDVGKEGDLYGTYDINRRLQVGMGYGRFYAGRFVKQNSGGADSAYPYGFLDYNF